MFTTLLLALAGASAATATSLATCPILLDGRVPAATALTDLDTTNALFNPDYVKGNDVKWSDALLFPADAPASRFDDAGAFKAVEVTINNASVFRTQFGFRRAGLQFVADTNTASPGYRGVVTLHWSIRADAARALNTSHEYLNVWHEAADYSADQIMFQTGTMMDAIDGPTLGPESWKFFDRESKLLWEVPRETEAWQNFAVTLDIDANTVQIYYSTGTDALEAATQPATADLSGEGQFQLGILKKPTGSTDVVNTGFQEAPFEEGLIYGGIFVEDSAGGCISL